MRVLSAVNSILQTFSGDVDPMASRNDPAVSFDRLMDELVAAIRPKSKPSECASAARQRMSEFERKLAFLSGMARQARIAMEAAEGDPGASSYQREYVYWNSKLGQVGMPDGVNNTI